MSSKCDRCGIYILGDEDFCVPCWEALPDADDTEAVLKDAETWFVHKEKQCHT